MSKGRKFDDAALGISTAIDDDMVKARDELVAAIEADDVHRTKALWRHLDVAGVDPFGLEIRVDGDEEKFDGHPCDWALERGSWNVLAHLLRMGLRRGHSNAEEIFGALASGIDTTSGFPEVVKCWTKTVQDVVRPTSLRQAHMLLNDTRLWEVGPIVRAAWVEVAEQFIANHERDELSTLTQSRDVCIRPSETSGRL